MYIYATSVVTTTNYQLPMHLSKQPHHKHGNKAELFTYITVIVANQNSKQHRGKHITEGQADNTTGWD